ncbi:BrnT family toxin [Halomonas ramblicola]|uniref:BrnT family toxin n=1 Tax=Halomonas ramblicola TaxID=747349 RepID=UPI0025B427E4|nr:BrnT family toxin [Halomonas ramblicola]MDN3521526.1 BrnT family toxin [Halomonas ramblicola]
MEITFDPEKSAANMASRGLSFELAVDFDWSSALVVEDRRQDYGEARFQALGLIGDRLHVLVFTPRPGSVRVISLRKANKREVRRYEQATRSGND